MLTNRDLNINRHICDASNDQAKPIKKLKQTAAQLERDLQSIEERIETRLQTISNGEQFSDYDVDVVHEFNQLKEDRFWRTEIEKRLTEHLDELAAREILRQEKLQTIERSTESSPAKRDAAYAKKLLQMDRENQLATRQRMDQDEMSRVLAQCLQNEEEKLREEGKKDQESKSIIGRLLRKLKRKNRK
jgi:hypothetical protein